MNNFLVSTVAQQEIMSLDQKIYETVDSIKALKTKREFMLSFASDPYGFINKWLISQSRDLKVCTISLVKMRLFFFVDMHVHVDSTQLKTALLDSKIVYLGLTNQYIPGDAEHRGRPRRGKKSRVLPERLAERGSVSLLLHESAAASRGTGERSWSAPAGYQHQQCKLRLYFRYLLSFIFVNKMLYYH